MKGATTHPVQDPVLPRRRRRPFAPPGRSGEGARAPFGGALPPDPRSRTLHLVRERLSGGRVELHPFPAGEPGAVMVEAGELALILHPSRRGMQALPLRDLRILAWCSRVALSGAALLTLAWILVFAALLGGSSLLLPTVLASAGLVLFLIPAGLSFALVARPTPVQKENPEAREVESALREALARQRRR